MPVVYIYKIIRISARVGFKKILFHSCNIFLLIVIKYLLKLFSSDCIADIIDNKLINKV